MTSWLRRLSVYVVYPAPNCFFFRLLSLITFYRLPQHFESTSCYILHVNYFQSTTTTIVCSPKALSALYFPPWDMAFQNPSREVTFFCLWNIFSFHVPTKSNKMALLDSFGRCFPRFPTRGAWAMCVEVSHVLIRLRETHHFIQLLRPVLQSRQFWKCMPKQH